jgi:hypothetical protein
MTPTHAAKKGVRYRYYVSRHLVTGAQSGDPGQRLPAPRLESLVIARLRAFLADPAAVDDALPEDRRDAPTRKRASDAAAELIQILDDPSSPSREPFRRATHRREPCSVDRSGEDPRPTPPGQSRRHDRRYCRRRRIRGDIRRSPSSFDVSRPGHCRSDSRRTAAVGADRQRAHGRFAAASGMVGAASDARISREGGGSLRAARLTHHGTHR